MFYTKHSHHRTLNGYFRGFIEKLYHYISALKCIAFTLCNEILERCTFGLHFSFSPQCRRMGKRKFWNWFKVQRSQSYVQMASRDFCLLKSLNINWTNQSNGFSNNWLFGIRSFEIKHIKLSKTQNIQKLSIPITYKMHFWFKVHK